MRDQSLEARAGVAGRSTWGSVKRILAYMQEYRWQLVLVGITVLTYTICYVLGPILVGRAIDTLVETGDMGQVGRIVLLMLGVYFGMWLSGIISGRVMAFVGHSTMKKLRTDLFNRMQQLSLKYYDRKSAGDLMSRLTNDMDALTQLLSVQFISSLRSFMTLIGMLFGMFFTSVALSFAALIVIPIMFASMFAIMKRIGPRFRELQQNLGALNGLMEENLAGQRVVIAYGQEGSSINDFVKANDTTKRIAINANLLANLIGAITGVLGMLNVVVVVAIGAWIAIREPIVLGLAVTATIGQITTMIDYTRRISFPLMELGNTFNSVIAALAGAERIFDIIDTEQDVKDKASAPVLGQISGKVVFDDVDFSYVKGEPILKNINLTAAPGEMIALVGPTGAGKTTIINMLTRFYDIEGGSIRIDGTDIRDVQQDSLREQLGIVLQDTYLFSDTVMENIRYGRLDATDEEVFEAARLANAHGFVVRLPDGYQTMLSERAENISQGQRQLLAIARAILADPRILILDEATSSVDTRTEVQIQEALLNLMEGRTSFVIAHRLSTIREADQILVLKDGEIIERGSHGTLLEANGFYRNLYTSQFKGTAVAE